MQYMSDELKETLAFSHTVYTKVEVFPPGQTVPEMELNLVDGSLTIDDVAFRRRASMTLTDDTGKLIPSDAFSLMSPRGTELQLWRGAYLLSNPDVHEEVPIGRLRLADVRVDDSGEGMLISVDSFDRARKISRQKFTQEYIVAPGTDYVAAIRNLIAFVDPLTQFAFPDTAGFTTPQLVFQTSWDPWDQAQQMAASIGYELFYDPLGICTLQPIEDPSVRATDWTYTEGESCMLLYLNKRLTDENTANHIIVTGETTDSAAPVRAEVADDDPASPTYYLGPFGDVVDTELGVSFVKTKDQAYAYAYGKLQKSKGLVELLEVTSLVNPAHEIGDIIYVKRSSSKVDSKYVVDKITLPLTHARGANLSSRERRL